MTRTASCNAPLSILTGCRKRDWPSGLRYIEAHRWDCPDLPDLQVQPDFVNAVAKIETDLTPQALLKALLQIEHQHGRERTYRNAPRTLDMDVLLYGDMQLHEHGLTIPHPQMHRRAFVLRPLLEISPDISIPGVGKAKRALEKCQDQVLSRIHNAV
jgi:2-amino-4-hydroxy-6-hydroxymethyldihydropteridine diphosphokinase